MWFTDLAKRRPLGTQTQPRLSAHDIVCVHTMVGYLKSTDAMFKANGYTGTESHFGIGGKWGSDDGLDGVAYQWQDTDYTADANYEGNHHVISIETADNAPDYPKDIVKWTPAQVSTLVALCAALCLKYDIPPALIPDTKPGRRGLAYHSQGSKPERVAGGENWSPGDHECPGPVRVAQFINEVIPKIQAAVKGEHDMTPDEMLNARVVLNSQAQVNAMNSNLSPGDDHYSIGDSIDLERFIRWGGPGQERLLHGVRETLDKIDALSDKVDQLAAKLADPPTT